MRWMIRYMKLRKIIFSLLSLFVVAGMAGHFAPAFAQEAVQEPVKVVVTVFPAYDWTMQILGDDPGAVEVTWLFDDGVDPHSYQPSMEDILKIADCDLFIYVGGESDKWVNDALAGAVNPDMKVLNLLEILGVEAREEELVEGMQEDPEDAAAEEEESVEGTKGDPEDATADVELDEHVWLSLRNAELFCREIAAALEAMDPSHAQIYQDNADAYLEQLQKLDESYKQTVSESSGDTILVADRFPFRYLADDYGLNYYAAFAGCSAETEASFETIIFLVQKVDELGLPCVLTIDGSDQKIAETIVQSTASKDQKILMLDSMQSETRDNLQAGETYLGVMEANLSTLDEALDY